MKYEIQSVQDLKATHELYKLFSPAWDSYNLAYNGGLELVKTVLQRHDRETPRNYQQRIQEGYTFNFARAIIDLFNFYLLGSPPTRNYGTLEEDVQFRMFLDDVDQYGTNYDLFVAEAQKTASIFGCVGILVNKIAFGHTKEREIQDKIYPYCAIYTPASILDWEWIRSPETGRPELTFVKLYEGDGRYILWDRDRWEEWQITKTVPIEKIDSGENKLGEIPFFWMKNMRNTMVPYLGMSDLVEIAMISESIIRNLSCGEEILKLAGFPMLRVPMETDSEYAEVDPQAAGGEVPAGVRAVQEFNPEFGADAKPDWMKTEVLEPIEAILKWIDRKADEIFRIAHLSGVHGQRRSNNEVASGLALRYEFQQLFSVLKQKSEYMTEAERNIVHFWLKWQNQETMFASVQIEAAKSFTMDDLSVSIDNFTKAMETIPSETFIVSAMKVMVKQLLPDITDENLKTIETEIMADPLKFLVAVKQLPVQERDKPAGTENNVE